MRIPFDFHRDTADFLSRVPTISRELAFIVAALALLLVCAGVLAQPVANPNAAGTPPPAGATPADKGGASGAIDCTKAANKSMAECSTDAVGPGGLSRNAPAGSDRGMQRPAPRTNDGMSGPNNGAAPRPSDISDGKTPQPR